MEFFFFFLVLGAHRASWSMDFLGRKINDVYKEEKRTESPILGPFTI